MSSTTNHQRGSLFNPRNCSEQHPGTLATLQSLMQTANMEQAFDLFS